jgi:beta-glucosidase
MGGTALAQLVFGEESFSGRLPVTFYKTTAELPDFTDYSMDGRTYRYMKNEPLYPFGYGLSYTTFAYSNLKIKSEIANGEALTVSVDVKNTGKMESDEVVQLYIRDEAASVRTANFSLCGFERVRLAPGASATVSLTVDPWSMEVVDVNGNRFIEPGAFTLFAGGSQPDALSERLTGCKCVSAQFTVK